MPQTILIVEDDPAQLRVTEGIVQKLGYRTRVARDGEAGLAALRARDAQEIDLVLLDLMMPGVGGLEVLRDIRPEKPTLPVIVLTAEAGIGTAVQAMQAGATDFLVKPAAPARLQVSIENALKLNQLVTQVGRLARKTENRLGFDDLIAKSLVMRQAIRLASRAADRKISVLLTGESGVGKEVMARAIHGASDRAGRAFVAVNCGAIPENLIESTLFGHEKGSFTGATQRYLGKFREADGGTLFLDEIGELRFDLQVKLLRALQEGEVDPVGGVKPVKVDVRIVSATNKDVWTLVEEGRFRDDLYFRLDGTQIEIPPLRERVEDIPALVDFFIRRFSVEEGAKISGVDDAALEAICGFGWPGNVRQLENAIYRAVVMCEGEILTPADFPQLFGRGRRPAAPDGHGDPRRSPGPALASSLGAPRGLAPAARHEDPSLSRFGPEFLEPFDAQGHLRTLAAIEAEMLQCALVKYDSHMSEIARRLGIGRSTLYRKVKELGLDVRGEDGADADAA